MEDVRQPLMRCAARAVPLGALIEVFGWPTTSPKDEGGRMTTGIVASIRPTGIQWLTHRLEFDDGRVVYTRGGAVAWVLEKVPS